MKKILIILATITIGLTAATVAHAQVDLPYLPQGESFSVQLQGKPVLYPVPSEDVSVIQEAARARSYDSRIVKIRQLGSIKGPRGGKLQAVGFARSEEEFGYDLYVVTFNGNLYYLEPRFVYDNDIMEKKNNDMIDTYNGLAVKVDEANAAWKASATKKAVEVESTLRKISSDESRIKVIIDSTINARIKQKEAVKGPLDAFVKDSIRIKTDAVIRDELRERRSVWTARREYLVNPSEVSPKAADYYAEEIAISKEIERLKKEIKEFERRNFLR